MSCVRRGGSFMRMLWPGVRRIATRIRPMTSDVVRGMGVTHFLGVGRVAMRVSCDQLKEKR